MQVFDDFKNEVEAIDDRLTVEQNPNYKQLANIKLGGKDICPIPSGEIREESDPTYTFMFPNGMAPRHRSRSEALTLIKDRLELIKDKDGHDSFFGIGAYAD